MFEYYFDLCNKPKYMLTISEELFIDIFPLLCIAAVAAIIILIAWIVDAIKNHKK